MVSIWMGLHRRALAAVPGHALGEGSSSRQWRFHVDARREFGSGAVEPLPAEADCILDGAVYAKSPMDGTAVQRAGKGAARLLSFGHAESDRDLVARSA